MIRIAAAARRALTRLTRAPGRHTQHDDEWDDASFAILRGQPATIPRADVAGAPPWNPATGWAGDCAPDPETWWLHHQAATDHQGGRAWPASGNGHVTAAEPLAPLPPEPEPRPPSAAAPAPATPGRPDHPGPAASPADALTLLDERQQLIDHAAAVIAAAKFDRILGMAASAP